METLVDRISRALANPLNRDDVIDPLHELASVLHDVGLEPTSGGGKVTFAGRDPIIGSPLPLATMAAVALMAKSVSIAALWRFRGGAGQNLSVNLGQALHRLCPFYDRKWELLNGYPPGNPADPNNPFMATHMYATRDGRRMLFMNIYPKIKTAALAFLGCNDGPRAVGAAIHSFFRYVAMNEPTRLLHCQRILSMPGKRYVKRTVTFLDWEEIAAPVAARP
jgi:hypothetical protein